LSFVIGVIFLHKKGGSWNFPVIALFFFYSSFDFCPIFVPIVFNFTNSHIGAVVFVAADVLIIAS
jgi:hypothetical protein